MDNMKKKRSWTTHKLAPVRKSNIIKTPNQQTNARELNLKKENKVHFPGKMSLEILVKSQAFSSWHKLHFKTPLAGSGMAAS